MRKDFLFIATILIAGFVFASCGSKGKTEENSIVGKWVYSSVNADVETSDPEATEKVLACLTKNDSKTDGAVVEFMSDGRMNNNGVAVFYSISGDKLTIKGEKGNEGDTKEFKIKGDTLSVYGYFTDSFDKDKRERLNINDSVRIEKANLTLNFVRKK